MKRMTNTMTTETPDRNALLDELDDATDKLHDARRDHAAAITAAHKAGISLRDIAAVACVSHQTVANIITRHRAGTA